MAQAKIHRVLTVVCLAGALVVPASAPASVASRFVDGTLSRSTDGRDSLAAGFDTRQLPLLFSSLAADPPAGVDPDRLYRALTRWHFYAGRNFDPHHRGLWSTGDSQRDTPTNTTLSTGAALELAELSALARLASARGHVFDPVVWWHDHLELGARLNRALYDPVHAAYADLDSLGRRRPSPDLSGLVPIALGARHGGEATRRAAWRLWTGSEERVEQGDLQTELAVRERTEAFEPWSADHGMHMIGPEAMAVLSLQALDDLDAHTLSVYARDALAARGITTRDSLSVHVGEWTRRLATSDLALRPLERSRAALRFLVALGVFAPSRAPAVLQMLDLPADAPDDSVSARVRQLTDLLVELRGMDPRTDSGAWGQQRGGRDDLDPGDRATFDFQWMDLPLWYGRALDLVTADVLQWYLRPDFGSRWLASLDPPLVGQGDRPRLVITSRGPDRAGAPEAPTVDLMWTDGQRLLPPGRFPLVRQGESTFTADVPELPASNGLWHLIVEGLGARPRIPAAVSVVDPVVVSLLPVDRRGATVDWSVQLRSQVENPVAGRVDLEAPLAFTTAPGSSLRYRLEPGGIEELEFSVTPDRDVTPGSYPLRWTVWSDARRVGQFEEVAHRPFAWLRIGPLPITDPRRPLDSPYAFDRTIDLARRVQGVRGTVAWTRLPSDRIEADGFVDVAGDDDPPAIHYAFTAFVTQSREAVLELETDGAAKVFVNGQVVLSLDRWGGHRETEVEFGPSTNFVVVKLADAGGTGARFRLRARDIDGTPLRGVGNELEHLLDNYAYLARARRSEAGVDESNVQRLVPIRYQDADARSVSVVGSFNGWSPGATPMTRLDDGTWQVKIRLRPGRFEYKFAVDGTRWIPDPHNPDAVDDGFGGRNSVLVVD